MLTVTVDRPEGVIDQCEQVFARDPMLDEKEFDDMPSYAMSRRLKHFRRL